MKKRGYSRLRRRGNAMVELPLSLWMLFVGLAFPLMALATIGLRYTVVVLAAHDAARAAARAPQFAGDLEASPGPPPTPAQPSAIHAAQTVAENVCKSFSGVALQPPVKVTIIEIVPPASPEGEPATISHGENTKLSRAYEPGHMYKIKIDLTATLDPLLTIPGIVGPFTTSVSAQQVAENKQGLNN